MLFVHLPVNRSIPLSGTEPKHKPRSHHMSADSKEGTLVRHAIMYLFNALCQVLLLNDVQHLYLTFLHFSYIILDILYDSSVPFTNR